MKITDNLLKKILVDTGIISFKEFNSTKKEALSQKKEIDGLIIEKGLVSDEELGRLIADFIKIPFINLSRTKLERNILNIVPEIVAKKQEIIVFSRTKKGLKVAMAHPENLEIQEFIERKTGEKVIPYFATRFSIRDSLKHYKKDIKEEFEEIIGESIKELKNVKAQHQSLPVRKMVETILSYGYENRASDIHIEPGGETTILRYRIDGVLHDVLDLPKRIHDFLISRIKILSGLRTDVHDAAQDGHFTFLALDEKVDIRVSVVPIEEGEKAVLRILAERSKKFDLQELGLGKKDLTIIKKNMAKSWGMILAAGPTGCGKTTTLYAILKILNTRKVNIMTIEDPIEYDIGGINQIQVNLKTNLTFPRGLKAIMRQDPNIIMVGEIRDSETAGLATNAAMTGHLVLSTFHATDSATVFTRLEDMGIEPFVIVSTVNIVVAQRLVRKICQKCIESYEVSISKLNKILPEDFVLRLPKTKKNTIRLFRGKGCPVCQNTGYLGRIGVFEVLEVSDPIKKLIMEKADASKIREEAIKNGMTTMIADGLLKVESGITTIEEISGTV